MTVSPKLLKNTDKQYIFREFANLIFIVVVITLKAGKKFYYTLKLLKLGYSIIISLLMEMHTDISDLI